MEQVLFSPHWYRVANVKPVLKNHVQIHRHEYRGLIWYIFADKVTGKNHRFSAKAYQIVGLMDGKRTIDQIWNKVSDLLGDFAPTQDEVIHLLGRLHAADLLQSSEMPDIEELHQRYQQQGTQKQKQKFHNPLVQKFPLWDPDNFLQRHLPLIRYFYTWPVAIMVSAVILMGIVSAAMHWPALTVHALESSLSPYHLVMMIVIYPVIKILHELGHAFSTKIEEGEVHEMGILFLLFLPSPYVNVSSASTFRSKYKRMLVSASGIIVELFLASLALQLWLSVEPGLMSDIAFSTMLIGGVSSLFFNGNPLLKYDGYYLLADAIDIPNLYQRSQRYLSYLIQKYIFGINNLSSPANASGEPGWFIIYSISSFLYRIALLWVIIVFITQKYFIIGVIIAFWLIGMQVLFPLIKGFYFVFFSPFMQQKRFRGIFSTLGIMLAVSMFFFTVPLPSYTLSEGVIWLPEQAQLRAETEGFAGQLLKRSSYRISENSPVVKISSPSLDSEVKLLQARLKELKTRFRSEWKNNQVIAAGLGDEIRSVEAELSHALKKQQSMLVKTRSSGTLIIPDEEDVTGRFFRQGELIGYVIGQALPIVRVAVTQGDMGLIQKQTEAVAIRLANRIDQIIAAKITRIAPGAINLLPSAALASTGGGKIRIEPASDGTLKSQQKLFHVDLEIAEAIKPLLIGERVYVRFDHGKESLASQWYRSIRQVFLGKFNV